MGARRLVRVIVREMEGEKRRDSVEMVLGVLEIRGQGLRGCRRRGRRVWRVGGHLFAFVRFVCRPCGLNIASG